MKRLPEAALVFGSTFNIKDLFFFKKYFKKTNKKNKCKNKRCAAAKSDCRWSFSLFLIL